MNEEQQGFHFKLQIVDLIFVLLCVSSLKIRSCKKLGNSYSALSVMINVGWRSGYIISYYLLTGRPRLYLDIYRNIAKKKYFMPSEF